MPEVFTNELSTYWGSLRSSLIKKDGDALFDHYRHALDALGKEKGLLGLIFNKALNKFDTRHLSGCRLA